jgi:nitrate/TMAO reductase-like tetraheme cytochrome c subunit
MKQFLSSFNSKKVAIAAVIAIGLFSSMLFLALTGQTAYALDGSNCLSCHSKLDVGKTTVDGRNVSLKIDNGDLGNSAHKYIDCTQCHAGNPHDGSNLLSKKTSAQKCGSCHQFEYQQYLTSIHGQQLQQGNTDVPSCVDCHSTDGDPHNVIRTLEYSATTYKKNIAETCAKCHNNQDLMDSYGIVDKVYESYMRSFHGKSLELSANEITKLDAATCTNCHGVHNIKSVTDPSAPVAGMDNLAQTCEKCHPGAGIEFAKGFLGHREASPSFVPVAHYVEKSFGILTYSVIGLGAVIVIGAIFGYSRRRWRK